MTTLTKRLLIVVAFLAYASGLVLVAQINAADEKNIQLANLAAQPNGLHAAALANNGKYDVGGTAPPMYRFPDLTSLVKSSPLIGAVTVTGVDTKLDNQGRDVVSVYTVTLDQAYKQSGNVSTINLVVPGGTYKFADGSIAIQNEPTSAPLYKGGKYILFLKPWPWGGPNEYRLVALGQGVFEVGHDGDRLISHTYLHGDPLTDEAKAGRLAFTQKLETLIASNK